MAAITNINSIKWENRNSKEDAVLETTKEILAKEYRVLRLLSERKEGE